MTCKLCDKPECKWGDVCEEHMAAFLREKGWGFEDWLIQRQERAQHRELLARLDAADTPECSEAAAHIRELSRQIWDSKKRWEM